MTGRADAAAGSASVAQVPSGSEAGGVANATAGDPSAGGQLTVHDVDSGENHFQAVAPAALAGTYGNFTFNAATGVWGYTLDQTKADPLTAGQTATDTLSVDRNSGA